MRPRPPGATRTDSLLPYPPLFRSDAAADAAGHRAGDDVAEHAAEVGFDHVAQVAARAHRRERGGDTAAHRRAVQAAGQSAEQGREQDGPVNRHRRPRSEEHTSELQSLMRTSSAAFSLTKTNNHP